MKQAHLKQFTKLSQRDKIFIANYIEKHTTPAGVVYRLVI
jgi:hypothetical protein